MTLYEISYVQIPLSIFYHFSMNFGLIRLFYKQTGQENSYNFVVSNKLVFVILLTFSSLVVQYGVFTIISYMFSKIYLMINQLELARLSLRVIVNHLNEAIFLRSEDGSLCFSNELGIKIIKQTCS